MAEYRTIELAVQTLTDSGERRSRHDLLAVEEPLEIRLSHEVAGQRIEKSISITMRTPGDDFELAAGFLYTEGIITSAEQIARITHCDFPAPGTELYNAVQVELQPDLSVDLQRLERHFYTSSSCGVCGKTSIAALRTAGCVTLPPDRPVVAASIIHELPAALRHSQNVFAQTGGLHASALFDTNGRLLAVREDVGRHNALDKLIGAQMLAGNVPLHDSMLLVSGRASFELVQKALMAGIPILAAVGAPSSLAVGLAQEYGMTVAGFVRDGRFNLYTGAQRIQ
jgi:FdhD protein